MKLTVTKLRENIYAILDQILETGESVEIERNGQKLRIEAVNSPMRSRLDRVVPIKDFIVGDPDDLVELDWSQEWSELAPSSSTPMSSSGLSPAKRKRSGKKPAK